MIIWTAQQLSATAVSQVYAIFPRPIVQRTSDVWRIFFQFMNLYKERDYSETTADPTYEFIRNNAAKLAVQMSFTPAVFTGGLHSSSKSENRCVTSRSLNSSESIESSKHLLQNTNRDNQILLQNNVYNNNAIL